MVINMRVNSTMEGKQVTVEDKIVERKLLLKRAFSMSKLFEIGKNLDCAYFDRFFSEWEIDEDEAALEIASDLSEEQLEEVFDKFKPRKWAIFRGEFYTLEDGVFLLEGSWKNLRANIRQAKKKFGKNALVVLRTLVEAGRSCSLSDVRNMLKRTVDPLPILTALEQLKVITTAYKGDQYQEWKILEETSSLVWQEVGAPTEITSSTIASGRSPVNKEVDYVDLERQQISQMDRELDEYLNDLLKYRLDDTIKFGKTFSMSLLADYLKSLFGPILYFDSLLSITQQYGLADVEIVSQHGETGMRTGWNLSLFGEPGTGKSFSTRDMILGKPEAKICAHGIPGRNRYAGGITPARFIRIGQAYVNRTSNFIVPEFNDWFRYKGMVEPLKLAMERGTIRYELHREVIGPYIFNSLFSVNYNVTTLGRGYEVTVRDPNFNAIEDRMLCRLHRLTKGRFVEIAKSQMRLALGEIDTEEGARKVRDHLTLVYAIETSHPLVKGNFPRKPVMITPEAHDVIGRAREQILEHIPRKVVSFSARLEKRAMQFACATSLLNYFHSDFDYVPVSDDALRYATQLYVEEASVRSREEFRPEEVLEQLF